MKIEVKKTHIRRGKQYNNEFCPIALAIKENLGVRKVKVNHYFLDIGKLRTYLPEKVTQFIRHFDERKNSVAPFTFEL